MNTATKARIAQLPEDVPATAVIAAWAGKIFEIRSAKSEVSDYVTWLWKQDTGGWKSLSTVRQRTLRRWLRENQVAINEPIKGFKVGSWETQLTTPLGLFVSTADSPEAAFTAAIEKFADSLRAESGKIVGASGEAGSTTQKE